MTKRNVIPRKVDRPGHGSILGLVGGVKQGIRLRKVSLPASLVLTQLQKKRWNVIDNI